jgi:hypothetical protein
MWPKLDTRLRVLAQELGRKFDVNDTAMRSGLTLPTLEELEQAKKREEEQLDAPDVVGKMPLGKMTHLTPSMIYNSFQQDQEAEDEKWDCCSKWKRSTPSAPTRLSTDPGGPGAL